MKKLLFLMILLSAFVLVACTNGGDSPTSEESASMSVTDDDLPSLFKSVFLNFYEKMDAITFEEAKAFIDNNYDAEITTPYEENGKTYGLYSITIKDESDMHIYMSFYLNEKNQETLSLITYGNQNYQISVSNNSHTSDVKYKTYAVDREPKSVEVITLDELSQFIFVDAKEKIQAYQESIESLKEINVELTAEPIIDSDGKVSFEITTNLPDNTVLMLTISGEDFTAQTKITIKNGTAVSEQCSNKGAALKGKFAVEVSMSLPKLQDESVTKIIGINGEFLVGDLVGTDNIVKAQFEFEF